MEQVKYDVFISYSRKDYVDEPRKDYVDEQGNVIPENEVSKIIKALSDANISYWLDKKGIVSGSDFAEQILKNIKASRILLYISSDSANKSDWIKREIAYASENNKKVIPLLLDNTPFQDAVMMRIVGLERIDYYLNPEKGMEKLITSIKRHLNELAEEERHQKELQLVEDIRTSVKELNLAETKLDLERSKLLVKTEEVADIGQRESLKTEITESSPIRKKTLAEIEKLWKKDVADMETKWNNEEARKNETLPKEFADKESESGTLREEHDSKKQNQNSSTPEKNKWVYVVLGLIIIILATVLTILCMRSCNATNSNSNNPKNEFSIVDSILEVSIDSIDTDVKFNMIKVEGGTFLMGAQKFDSFGDNYDSEAKNNESPVHNVTLDSYYIGETEVTQALWKAVMDTVPSEKGGWIPKYGKGDDYPAYRVSWNDVQDFIRKLNQNKNMEFRLPTEEEWEYAARGGHKRNGDRCAGNNSIGDVAWYWVNSGDIILSGLWNSDSIDNNHCKTHPVKCKDPNELGLYDMKGNVWEWCQNGFYKYDNVLHSASTDPLSDSIRVLRGGSWFHEAKDCRVSNRWPKSVDIRYSSIGFRLVLPIKTSSEEP